MMELAVIFVGIALVNNFVLVQFLGICPFLGVSKKLDSALGMSIAVIFVMTLATAVTWPVYQLLKIYKIEYLETIAFILIIAALVQFVEIIMKKYLPALYRALGVFLPLITTNCAVLGVTIMNIDEGYSYIEALVNTVGAGVGFLIAMVLFAGVRQKIENSDIPQAFKGVPSILIAASIVSLSFMGFSGMVG